MAFSGSHDFSINGSSFTDVQGNYNRQETTSISQTMNLPGYAQSVSDTNELRDGAKIVESSTLGAAAYGCNVGGNQTNSVYNYFLAQRSEAATRIDPNKRLAILRTHAEVQKRIMGGLVNNISENHGKQESIIDNYLNTVSARTSPYQSRREGKTESTTNTSIPQTRATGYFSNMLAQFSENHQRSMDAYTNALSRVSALSNNSEISHQSFEEEYKDIMDDFLTSSGVSKLKSNSGSPSTSSPTDQAQPTPQSRSQPLPSHQGKKKARSSAFPHDGKIDPATRLDDVARRRGLAFNWRESVIDLMTLLELDLSLVARKRLAARLSYEGSANDIVAMDQFLLDYLKDVVISAEGDISAARRFLMST